jgi:hypothetical protein
MTLVRIGVTFLLDFFHKRANEGPSKPSKRGVSRSPPLRRKDAVAGAVATGVAFYTARTQYQKWFAARRHPAA